MLKACPCDLFFFKILSWDYSIINEVEILFHKFYSIIFFSQDQMNECFSCNMFSKRISWQHTLLIIDKDYQTKSLNSIWLELCRIVIKQTIRKIYFFFTNFTLYFFSSQDQMRLEECLAMASSSENMKSIKS